MRKSRWPKHKVVKWLELGAIPALIGLWIPNWIEGYIRLFSFGTSEGIFTATFPPVITYIGVLILFKASTEGIKNMGIHYKRAVLSGIISVILAVLSVVTHFLISKNPLVFGVITLLTIGFAAFFSLLFLWNTLAKVAEISAESRTRKIRDIVLLNSIIALVCWIAAIVLVSFSNPLFAIVIRLAQILFTVTILFCRYGVYCYKTQKSIGAVFASPPDNQFWI